MYQSASRRRSREFIGKLDGIGRGDVAAYVRQQVGCSRTTHPGLPLDRERYALWARFMVPPVCPACGCPADWHDDGRCPEPDAA